MSNKAYSNDIYISNSVHIKIFSHEVSRFFPTTKYRMMLSSIPSGGRPGDDLSLNTYYQGQGGWSEAKMVREFIHSMGHMVGLAHSNSYQYEVAWTEDQHSQHIEDTSNDDTGSVMYRASPVVPDWTGFSNDDIKAIYTLYPKTPSSLKLVSLRDANNRIQLGNEYTIKAYFNNDNFPTPEYTWSWREVHGAPVDTWETNHIDPMITSVNGNELKFRPKSGGIYEFLVRVSTSGQPIQEKIFRVDLLHFADSQITLNCKNGALINENFEINYSFNNPSYEQPTIQITPSTYTVVSSSPGQITIKPSTTGTYTVTVTAVSNQGRPTKQLSKTVYIVNEAYLDPPYGYGIIRSCPDLTFPDNGKVYKNILYSFDINALGEFHFYYCDWEVRLWANNGTYTTTNYGLGLSLCTFFFRGSYEIIARETAQSAAERGSLYRYIFHHGFTVTNENPPLGGGGGDGPIIY